MTFHDFPFDPALLEGIDSMNFVEPTPIQEQTIPPLLEGRDLLGIAQTGTGKTAAYLLPIINRIYKGEFPGNELKAVVVVPTRELALQIDRQVQGFGYFVGVSSMAIYGGTDGIVWEQQMRSLREGVDIVIATPGRLIDLLNMGDTTIAKARYLVVDEADRMLDMGFQEDIQLIRSRLAKNCQIALFSATMPDKIRQLGKSMLKEPVIVELEIAKPPESIRQYAYVCYDNQKLPLLLHLFNDKIIAERTVVFVKAKKTALEITPKLNTLGFNIAQMHSDLEQQHREQVMRDFKAGKIDVLVATDIVARGIDIVDIESVVNFDLPRDHEDYVHRIGRTARGADSEGQAFTLVTDRELSTFDDLQYFLGKEIKLLTCPDIGEVPSYSFDENKKPTRKKKWNKGRKANAGKRTLGKNAKYRQRAPKKNSKHAKSSTL